MTTQLFTATGCHRCEIVKTVLKKEGIDYEEWNIREEGKDVFKTFYKENRKQIFRSKDGVEFPVLAIEGGIHQGLGPILAYAMDKNLLFHGFVTRAQAAPGWVNGLSLVPAECDILESFFDLMARFTAHGLNTRVVTHGSHPGFLERLLDRGYISRLDFQLLGPTAIYPTLTGKPMPPKDLNQSLALLAKAKDYTLILPVSPIKESDGTWRWLTPEEAGQAAAIAAEASGSKTHPFVIRPVAPPKGSELAPLENKDFFKYRTATRRYMVKSEIEKPENGIS